MTRQFSTPVKFASLFAMFVILGLVPREQQICHAQTNKPKFTISPSTTFITEPVHANGHVDFAAAINSRLSVGITAANNACIPLYEAIGPSTAQIDTHLWLWGPRQVEAFFQSIGASPHIYKKRSALHELRPTLNVNRHFQAYVHPDSRFDHVFRLLHVAARCDRYYSPLITNGASDGRPQALMGASYPSNAAIRCAAELLLTRAQALDERDASWKDILASYRLGRLVGLGPEVDDALLGMQIEEKSIAAALRFIDRFHPDAIELKNCQTDLAGIPEQSSVGAKVNLSERCRCLDALLYLAWYMDPKNPHIGFDPISRGFGGICSQIFRQGIREPNWDPTLKEINTSHDEIVRVLNLPTFGKCRQALDQLESKWKTLRAPFTLPDRGEFSKLNAWEQTPEFQERMETLTWLNWKLTSLTNTSAGAVNVDTEQEAAVMRIAGRAAATMVQPMYVRAHLAEERTRQRAHNLEVAFALSAYYADHAMYPEELAHLKPKYLTETPIDLFVGKAPIYRPLKDGFVLYSVGENQQDDDGKYNPQGADDLGVQLGK